MADHSDSVADQTIGANQGPALTITETLFESYLVSILKEVDAIAERANIAPKAIKSDADLDLIGLIVTDARALSKKTDKIREAEKAPYLLAGNEVQDFFRTPLARLDRMVKAFEDISTAYHRKVRDEERRKAENDARIAREEENRRQEAARTAEEEGRSAHAAIHKTKAEDAAATARVAETTVRAAPAAKTITESGVTSKADLVWTFEVTNYQKVALDTLRPYIKREVIEAAIKQSVKMGARGTELGDGVRIYEDVKAGFR